MIETYIKNIPIFSEELLEGFLEQCMGMPNTTTKRMVVPALINEKLKRYEQEY